MFISIQHHLLAFCLSFLAHRLSPSFFSLNILTVPSSVWKDSTLSTLCRLLLCGAQSVDRTWKPPSRLKSPQYRLIIFLIEIRILLSVLFIYQSQKSRWVFFSFNFFVFLKRAIKLVWHWHNCFLMKSVWFWPLLLSFINNQI